MEEVLGVRVEVGRDKATIRWKGVVGESGEWLGVEWDNSERGKHDGTHRGVRYFSPVRDADCCSFIRREKVTQWRIPLEEVVKEKYGKSNKEQIKDLGTLSLKVFNSIQIPHSETESKKVESLKSSLVLKDHSYALMGKAGDYGVGDVDGDGVRIGGGSQEHMLVLDIDRGSVIENIDIEDGPDENRIRVVNDRAVEDRVEKDLDRGIILNIDERNIYLDDVAEGKCIDDIFATARVIGVKDVEDSVRGKRDEEDRRANMLGEKVEWKECEDTGFVRDSALSVDRLVYVPAWEGNQEMVETREVDRSTEDRQELDTENIPDCMEGKQTLPIVDEMFASEQSRARVGKKVPKGTNEYQDAWIQEEQDCDGGSTGEEDRDEEMEVTGGKEEDLAYGGSVKIPKYIEQPWDGISDEIGIGLTFESRSQVREFLVQYGKKVLCKTVVTAGGASDGSISKQVKYDSLFIQSTILFYFKYNFILL